MQKFVELTKGTGRRQKIILFELEKQAIISLNKETGLWMRDALTCKYAKYLLKNTDKTIDEQIKEIEQSVLRLEKEAQKYDTKLNGGARFILNELYKKKKEIYMLINNDKSI